MRIGPLRRALAGLLSGELAPAGRRIGYHGTPFVFAPEPGAPFGRFRSDRIGSGFGRQAYGHGIYDSDSFSLADAHRHRLLGQVSERWLQSSHEPEEIASGALYIFGDKRTASRELTRLAGGGGRRRSAINAARALIKNARAPRGRVMEVDAPVGGYLDWDAPLAGQEVSNALSPLGPDMSIPGWMLHDQVVRREGSQAAAAKAFEKAGVRGITYRSGDTRNHVQFNPDDYNIRAIRAALLAILGGAGAGAALTSDER